MAVLPSTPNFRPEKAILTYIPENRWGAENRRVRTYGKILGITEAGFTFPDPEFEWFKYRHPRSTGYMPSGITAPSPGQAPAGITGSVGTPSVRNWTAIYDGVRRHVGNVSDVRILSGHIFPFIFGAASNETVSGAYYTHYILERVELPSFTLEAVLFNTNGTAASHFVRRARGCKVNRATIFANEGEELRVSLDEIIAKGIRHNISGVASTANEREWLGYDSRLAWTGAASDNLEILMGSSFGNYDTYKFSEGSIEVYLPNGGSITQPDIPSFNNTWEAGGTPRHVATLARIKSFRLTVNNNITPHYWINNLSRLATDGDSGNGTTANDTVDDQSSTILGQMIPSALVEGAREYELEIQAAVADHYIYQLLMTEGKFGRNKRGYGIRLKFVRQRVGADNSVFASTPNDYIEIHLPADTSNGLAGSNERDWEGTSWDSADKGPVGGMGDSIPWLGCFLISAGYPVESSSGNDLIYSTMRLEVPSVSLKIRDTFGDYLNPYGT